MEMFCPIVAQIPPQPYPPYNTTPSTLTIIYM